MQLCVFCSGSGTVGPLIGSEDLSYTLFSGDESGESIDPQIDHLASCVPYESLWEGRVRKPLTL